MHYGIDRKNAEQPTEITQRTKNWPSEEKRDRRPSEVELRLNEKSAHGDANTVVRRSQKFSPRRTDPLPGGAGRPEFNQLEMVNTFTYRPGLVRIDALNFELSW